MKLYHISTKENCEKIKKEGFKVTEDNLNFRQFGSGVYFAREEHIEEWKKVIEGDFYPNQELDTVEIKINNLKLYEIEEGFKYKCENVKKLEEWLQVEKENIQKEIDNIDSSMYNDGFEKRLIKKTILGEFIKNILVNKGYDGVSFSKDNCNEVVIYNTEKIKNMK